MLGWFAGGGSMGTYWHPGDGRLFWSGYEAGQRDLRYDADAVRFGDMSKESFGQKYRGFQIYSSDTEVIDHANGRLTISHDSKTVTVGRTYFVESEGGTRVKRSQLRKLNKIDNGLNKKGYVAESGRLSGYKVKFQLNFVAAGSKEKIRDLNNNWSSYPSMLTSNYGNRPRGFFVESARENVAFEPYNHKPDGSYLVRGGYTISTGSIFMNSSFFFREGFVLHEIFHSLGLRSGTDPHDHNFGSGLQGVFGNRPPTTSDVDALLNLILNRN